MVRRGKDPTHDIYALFDEAGLGLAKFSTRKSMIVIINEIRTSLALLLKSYMHTRELQAFDAGYNKRKEEELEERQAKENRDSSISQPSE